MRATVSELSALVSLRWRMVRRPSSRIGFAVLAGSAPVIAALTIAGAQAIPAQRAFDLTLVTPTLFLAFAVLAVIAPLAAGGGNELFPPEQLAAYPVRPSTVFAGSLLLAPLNLAWIVQVIILLASSSLLIRNNVVGMMAALFTTLAYIALITTLGQALGWAVMGVRQSRRGRVLVWIAATVTVLTFLVLWRADVLVKLLDASPTRWVIVTGLAESNQDISRWVSGTALMLLLFIAAIPLGARIVGWVQRRPGDSGVQRDARAYGHRSSYMSALAQLRMIDRASVWRSSSLRRGVLVLGFVPGAVAALAALQWQSLVLLPGLVAAGAGLLFGVNAFCLDASGALWLSSLPGWSRTAFTAKALVLTEACTAAVVIAVGAAALRAPAPGRATEVAAVVACGVSCVALVVATCMRLSVSRPHRADLRGPRDTPAPPGTMAVYSVRLAVTTTLVGLAFSILALADTWWLPLVAAVPLVCRSGLSLATTRRSWDDPVIRSRVVSTVAAG